jgi:hypothetical protein
MAKSGKTVDHSGSTLDSLLGEDGILAQVEAVAVQRVMEWQRHDAEAAACKTRGRRTFSRGG